MPEKRLTALTVAKIGTPKPGRNGEIRRVDYWDSLDGGGSLGLRVSSNGVRTWVVMPRLLLLGKQVKIRVTLGRFPQMSLAEARVKATEAILAAKQGKDPREIVHQERQSKVDESRNTFGNVADEFLTKYVARECRPATEREYRRALKGPDVAGWQSRLITQVSKRDLIDLLDGIIDSQRSSWANAVRRYLSKFFAWCAERDLITVVPTDRVRQPAKNVSRERVLSNSEVGEVWAALENMDGLFGPLYKISLLTGQRLDEVSGMRWDELHLQGDSPTWELPGDRTKNGRPHVVPLPPRIVGILNQVRRLVGSPFVFTKTGQTPVSGFSKAKVQLEALIVQRRKDAGISAEFEHFVIHDLRRTVATRMHEDLGIAPHIVEAVLNHVSGARAGVAGTYNRALYLDDKRRALVAWANHVERLVNGATDAANVVPFRPAASDPRA